MNTPEKMLGVINESQITKIVVTHVTIRQSISILLLRLVLVEILSAVSVIIFHTLTISTNITDIAGNINDNFSLFNIPIFLLLVFIKTCLMAFIIIQWVSEYYEITPKEIIYKRGFIFKKEQRHKIDHLSSLEIDQGILGKIFNYGTIKLFNWSTEKNLSFYLIHNPMKYHHILQTLLPSADKEEKIFRTHLIESEEL